MATKEIKICDKCTKVIEGNPKTLSYVYDREMDESGNGYNDCYRNYDLCQECSTHLLKCLLRILYAASRVIFFDFQRESKTL